MFKEFILNILNLFYSTSLYQKVFLRKTFNINPILNLQLFSPMYFVGHSVLAGEFNILGQLYQINDFKNLAVLNSKEIEFIHRFSWLPNFAVLQTIEAATKSVFLVENWLNQYSEYDEKVWDLSVLSERVFHIIINYNFLMRSNNTVGMSKLDKFLTLQINHLLNAYKKFGAPNDFHVAKALIAVSFVKDKEIDKLLLEAGFTVLKTIIKEGILADGGHISRNPGYTLDCLQNILIIYYMLKDKGIYDVTFLRVTIDKITNFIRTMRHPNGTLGVFNGGNEGSKRHIDFLLSLCQNSSQASVHLRASNYTRFQGKDAMVIVDVGAPTKTDNALFSFELSIQNNKLITNLGRNFKTDKNNILNQGLFGRLSYSGLIIKNYNNEIIFFNFKPSNIKQKRRTEENWEILEMHYTHEQVPAFDYFHTIYISRSKPVCVLSEDYLNFKMPTQSNIKEAFLRIHLSPQVKDLELLKNNHALLITMAQVEYLFVSCDNPMQISKSVYAGELGLLQPCYTIDIPFNLQNKIVKNEWNISTAALE